MGPQWEGQGASGPYRGGGIGPGALLQQHVDDMRVALLGGLVQGRVAVLWVGAGEKEEEKSVTLCSEAASPKTVFTGPVPRARAQQQARPRTSCPVREPQRGPLTSLRPFQAVNMETH